MTTPAETRAATIRVTEFLDRFEGGAQYGNAVLTLARIDGDYPLTLKCTDLRTILAAFTSPTEQ